jgi:predicted nucleic-acid-binding Zn-ribbon protein
MTETCSRCGSDKMMEDVRLSTEGGLVAYVQSNPNALLLKGTVSGTLRARVCGGCGYTEIYTKNFKRLYEAYQQSQGG